MTKEDVVKKLGLKPKVRVNEDGLDYVPGYELLFFDYPIHGLIDVEMRDADDCFRLYLFDERSNATQKEVKILEGDADKFMLAVEDTLSQKKLKLPLREYQPK